jgi:VanZ family protein
MWSILAVLALATLILLPPPSVPFLVPYPHLYGVVENCAHPLIFAVIALIALGRLSPWSGRSVRPPWQAYFLVLGVALLLGATTETIQRFIGRDCSLEDLINDLLGASFTATLHAWWHLRGRPQKELVRKALLIAAALCAVLIGLPLVWAGAAYAHRTLQLPVLWRAGDLLDSYFVSTNGPDYPGVTFDEPWPDWSQADELRVTVRNLDAAAVRISLRVNDRQHNYAFADRYNAEFEIPPQSRQTLSVPISAIEHAPKGRLMNLRQIANLELFRQATDIARVVLVEEVRLVPRKSSGDMKDR